MAGHGNMYAFWADMPKLDRGQSGPLVHYWQTGSGTTSPTVAWLEAGPLWANSAYMEQLL